MLDFFQNLDPGLKGPVIGAAATCFAALLGFTAVFLQLGNAIKANKKNEQIKRKVEIYEQTLGTSRNAEGAGLKLQNYLNRFQMSLDLVQIWNNAGDKWQIPAERYPQYLELRNEASTAFIGVITMIESWHIVEPKLDVFRYAISMGLEELSKVQRPPDLLVYKMPVHGHESTWSIPSPEEHADIMDRLNRELRQIQRLLAWVGDFKVEMQILLLGELFPNNTLERRQPYDPDFFCIRLDRHKEIMRKIHGSEWMDRQKEFEIEARKRFAPRTNWANLTGRILDRLP
ncbi:hypothetical protein ACK9YZ_11150 [Rhizobium sp. ZK1]|uniref:hypothetical protein n=1 Tax=Rhizobium sp. ZK1 TaxID=3389872 RepID=UPI0039F67106